MLKVASVLTSAVALFIEVPGAYPSIKGGVVVGPDTGGVTLAAAAAVAVALASASIC